MKTKLNQAAAKLPKGITAVHCFNGTAVSPEDHQKLINGPIAVVKDVVEEARKRIDTFPQVLSHAS